LLVLVVGVLFLCYVTSRLLLAYQMHRASQLMATIQSVRVGDSETSLSSLLNGFDGYRWNVQLGAGEDYNYVLEINPWRYPTLSNHQHREHPIETGLNARLRRVLGLREWVVMIEVAVKKQQVVAVEAETFVEGRNSWLATSWRLSENPREFERNPTVDYLQWPPESHFDFVSPAILEMGTGGGASWEFWMRPFSPGVQRQVASQWDFSCLNSFRGCDTLCDLLPQAARFFKEQSELAPKGGGWDEDSGTCKHDPKGRYY
jgi:flagellar biogenesis protein FliO